MGPLGIGVWLVGAALAHDFSTHTLAPTDDWCAELHRLAQPADVIELLPGRYPGGCDLTLGGLVELNEALLVAGLGDADTIIEVDAQGLSLRISGEPVRLYGLTLEGRLELAADHTTVDASALAELVVLPHVSRVTVLFSELDDLVLDLDQAVVRGNTLGDLQVVAATGLVADNTVLGSAEVTVPFERNLVLGDLTASHDGFANVVVGTTEATGRLYGNTLLGPVRRADDARNNLTTAASLPTDAGNLQCVACLADPARLDVRPRGRAVETPPVEAPDDDVDFCGEARTTIGAVGAGALQVWTALDRDAEGCVEGEEPDGEGPGEESSPSAGGPMELGGAGCVSAPGSWRGAWSLVGLLTRHSTGG